MKPKLVFLARVFHNDINPETKVIKNSLLDQWDISQKTSNLLSVIKDIHSGFDADPPIPENDFYKKFYLQNCNKPLQEKKRNIQGQKNEEKILESELQNKELKVSKKNFENLE